jgi:mannose-1-phosphate guanylyltransferase/mannose-6-phosphate isomerase
LSQIIPIILCGGAGRRLRPLSTPARPKQFFKLRKNGLTLFQDTMQRASVFTAPIIVTSAAYKDIVAAQLRDIGVKPRAIIAEPVSCNTGPAIGLALHYLQRQDITDHGLIVLPCDHLMDDFSAFVPLVEQNEASAQNHIILFGITPRSAQSAYGYIEIEETVANIEGHAGLHVVASFTEKPSKERAGEYITTGRYYWNSGIFLMSYAAALEAFREYAPAMWYQIQNLDPLAVDRAGYEAISNRAFDRLILECAQNIRMQHSNVHWADIGSWRMFLRYIHRFHIFK